MSDGLQASTLARYAGLIWGQAVGDALLLPYEFLHPAKARRRLAKLGLRQSLLGAYGMTSDDTDHLFLTGQALLVSQDEVAFGRCLARALKWWFWSLPPGIGLATLRSALKLTLGFPYTHSGVWSAGNGPAMRVPLIALHHARDTDARNRLIRVSTRITHTDPQALAAAQGLGHFVAYLAREGALPPRSALAALLLQEVEPSVAWRQAVEHLCAGLDQPAAAFARPLGGASGVSGYMLHTVPFALHVVMRETSPEAAFRCIVETGGDTDTIGAIVGALLGVVGGPQIFPPSMTRLLEYPRTKQKLLALAHALCHRQGHKVSYRAALCLPRNLFCTLVVLAHALRRVFW